MIAFLNSGLQTLSEIISAGIAITAFSLLMYALTFNLRDRVARSFAIILTCVMIVFAGEVLSSVATQPINIELLLRIEWLGIIFLPPAYLHFSDALLEKTGRPSRGRRRKLVYLSYLISIGFLVTLPFYKLVGSLILDAEGVYHLARNQLTWFFILYYVVGMLWAWTNFWRAYQRTVTSTSLRRMRYLLAGALAPAMGSFPFLLFGANFASTYPTVFWLAAISTNLLVLILLVVMAYAVAFFGVSWPDRVVKRRLAKWLMRGPVTASMVLAFTTIVRRTGEFLGTPNSLLVPVVMVAVILLMQYWITMTAPTIERWFFTDSDRNELQMLQHLEDRLLTIGDLRQFLEAVLAAVCDQLQVSTAFVAAIGSNGVELIVNVGNGEELPKGELSKDLLRIASNDGNEKEIFAWGNYWLLPLFEQEEQRFLGLLGFKRKEEQVLHEEQQEALTLLGKRAALALNDRRIQQEFFTSLRILTPQVELIQRLRAASRYDQESVLTSLESLPEPVDLSQYVKDALSHYWGGPKLTENPLMRLQVVQRALEEHEGNPVNALRSTLKKAIEHVKPEGEQRFTAEWILYNILELKFMEGRKVREVALRLAMSEADLYRKQRVAIEAVANAIIDMERLIREEELEEAMADYETEDFVNIVERLSQENISK